MKMFESTAHSIARDFHKHGEWFHFRNTSAIIDVVEDINKHYEKV